MVDADFFRRQAEKCLRLSRTSYDMETSRQLRLMAMEFLEKAEENNAGEDFMPGAYRSSNGSEGDLDRD